MTTKKEFEAMILEAIDEAGDIMTLGADNGVEIDTYGPRDGSSTTVEGWHSVNGARAYFAATLTITLDEYAPDFDEGAGDDD